MSHTELVASRHAGTRGMKWMLSGLVVAVAATFALSAWAMPDGQGPRGGHGGPGMMEGPGMMFGGPGMMMGGRGVDRMLDGLNATDAQRTQIKQILKAAADDMQAQRRDLHERGLQIFSAPEVDAAAAEQLRQQMLQQREVGSKRMLQAMLDVSKVLTPEQRVKLAERIRQHDEMRKERMDRMEHGQRPQRP